MEEFRITHTKRVYEDFQIKKLDQYHDSYVERDTLLLAGVFVNFWNTYLQIYQVDPARFL